jgi:hypothetical protein
VCMLYSMRLGVGVRKLGFRVPQPYGRRLLGHRLVLCECIFAVFVMASHMNNVMDVARFCGSLRCMDVA